MRMATVQTHVSMPIPSPFALSPLISVAHYTFEAAPEHPQKGPDALANPAISLRFFDNCA